MAQLQSPLRRWLAPILGAGAVAGTVAIMHFLGACSSADRDEPKSPVARAATAVPLSEKIEIPKFGQPEEAKRFFDASIAGDRRSLVMLEDAIKAARSNSGSDSRYVAELEHERSLRTARVQAFESARRDVEARR